jgi:hypothetical protein
VPKADDGCASFLTAETCLCAGQRYLRYPRSMSQSNDRPSGSDSRPVPRPGRRESPLAILAIAASVGAAIWVGSPFITGEPEPWDAEKGLTFLYYPGALFLAGLACGFVTPRRPFMVYAGLVAGQASYMLLVLPGGPLVVLGLVFLAFYTTLAMVGFAAARVVWSVLGVREDRPTAA